MYDILQLNDMLVPELLDIAEQLKIPNSKKLDKQELVRRSNDLVDVPSFAGVATRHLIPDALEEYRLEAWRPAWDTAPKRAKQLKREPA